MDTNINSVTDMLVFSKINVIFIKERKKRYNM